MSNVSSQNPTASSEPKSAPESIPEYANDYISWHYEQPLPSVVDPVKWYFAPFKQRVIDYLISLFPVLQWIHRYNLKWLWGDLVAGITVGIVVVPQGMSYAKVAGLPVEYGLYSSFIGVMLYCFFATSKDVSIGPVAVMSSETYRITREVVKKVPELTSADYPVVAQVLCLLCGGVTLGIGILRLGFLLEYIPMPAVMGFMTGSAFTIIVGQVKSLFGISKYVKASGGSHNTVIQTLKNLHHANYDAAFGVVSLFVLYFIKFSCDYLEKRDRKRKWLWFYLNTLRAALVIIFTTLISWGCYRIYGKSDNISRIGVVPRGLQHVGVHTVNPKIASALGSELPIAVVILVLEHIAISKSFGRINEYRINPNQELIAIGVSNLIGQFFMSYPNTGSFSRTALKNKCGVRTPLAGIFTGICVLIAIYALTDAFYYISNATLSAIIIHAVCDLMASWRSTYKFYLVSPIECLIFIVDVFLCVFVTLEAGIYFSVAASLVYLLLKQTFPLGEFLGKVEFTRHVSDEIPNGQDQDESNLFDGTSKAKTDASADRRSTSAPAPPTTAQKFSKKLFGRFNFPKRTSSSAESAAENPSADISVEKTHNDEAVRSINSVGANSDFEDSRNTTEIERFDETVMPSGAGEPSRPITQPIVHPQQSTKITKWWPLTHDNIQPGIRIVPPPPGIFVYRFRESVTYQNVSWQTDRIVEHIRQHTRRNIDIAVLQHQKLGDRPWNERGPRKYTPPAEEDTRPVLRAVIFDMSCSPNVDLTGAQGLWDCHQELTKYACVPVEFHFAGILSEWSRRTLVRAGFGHQNGKLPPHTQRLIELGAIDDAESQLENGLRAAYAPVVDSSQCYFHFDIPDLQYR